MTAAPPPLDASAAHGQPQVLARAAPRLAALRRRVQAGVAIETAAFVLLGLLAYAVVSYAVDRNLRLEVPFRTALLAVFACVAGRTVRRRLLRPLGVRLSDDEMALAVERQAPSLRQALISAMQFERVMARGDDRESPDLMRAVLADVHGRFASLPFARALDGRRVARFAGIAGAVLAVFAAWGIADGASLRLWAQRNLLLSGVEWPRYTQLAFLGADGVVRLPQGDALTLRVAVAGRVPDQVFLRSRFAGGDGGVEAMSRTGDGEYTLTMETLIEDAVLVAEGGDGLSAPLQVQIVERPRIEDVVVQVVYPDYMHKEIEALPGTEGEVRLVRGSELRIAARSHKAIDEAFLLFADQKLPLEREGEFAFRGAIAPRQNGLLVVDVIDRDRLGAGAPPRLLVRIVDDKPPAIDFKLRGVSSLVTPQVRIPGELKVRDDFGIVKVAASFRAVDDAPERQASRAPGEAPPPEVPYVPIEPGFSESLVAGSVRYEATATVDIKPLQRSDRPEDPTNPVRPGMLLSLRFQAVDNFGPGDPHEAFGEAFSFRVVTREKLVEELRRRQVEQRLEVVRIRDDVALGQLSLAQNPVPTGGDPRPRQQLKALAGRQQSLGRRAAFAADLYQRILWEYENNRIWEPGKVREFEALTAVPLAALARDAFPKTSHEVATFADSGDEELRTSAVDGYKEIVARLDAIVKVMEQVETLAALIEQLRGVINIENKAIQDVERQIQDAGSQLFKPSGK